MTEDIEALPSGSYVAISHFFDPEIPERRGVVQQPSNA
jgi:hypothetical protein